MTLAQNYFIPFIPSYNEIHNFKYAVIFDRNQEKSHKSINFAWRNSTVVAVVRQ